MDTFCEVVADFTDIRSEHTWNHSRIVATTAEAIGRSMGLAGKELPRLRRAALVHDLGKAALPYAIMEKQGGFTEGEWESFRLHPYYTERIVARVDRLKPLLPDAGAHHEWINGEGYHRQLKGDHIPLGGRILAVADAHALMSKTLSGRDGGGELLREMGSLVGTQLDGDCFDALVRATGGATPASAAPSRSGQGPGNLSERETEVLRELAKGLTN